MSTSTSIVSRSYIVSLSENLRRGGLGKMSGGADEELWGDDDDDAMLAMIDNPDQVLSLLKYQVLEVLNHVSYRVVVVA